MKPQDGPLAEAYDLIETYLFENSGENQLPEERLTAPRGTHVWVTIVSYTNSTENSYFLAGSASESEGWLAAERLLNEERTDLLSQLTRHKSEELNKISLLVDCEDRVVALVELIRSDILSIEEELVVDVYLTLVKK
jgi:hypothetical protein